MRTHLVPCLAILALSLLAIPAGAEPMSAAGPGSTAATSGGAARTTNGNAKAVTRKPTAEPSRPAPVSRPRTLSLQAMH